MFRPDTVNDTTPEVLKLIKTLFPAFLRDDATTTTANQTNDPNTSDSARSGDAVTHEVCPPLPTLPVYGHVFLSSLPRVTALARRRELLVQQTTCGASAQPRRAFVRLVLSLLSFSSTEGVLSPATSTDEREARSPSSVESAHATPLVASPIDDGDNAAMLPWCTAAASAEDDGADITYTARCVSDGVDATCTSSGFSCQLALRACTVAVVSADVTRSLAQYWFSGTTPAAHESARPTPPNSTAAVRNSDDRSSTAACFDGALEGCRARMRRHELRCLRCLASTCEDLLRQLDRTEGSRDDEKEDVSAPPLSRVVIRVPIYGVALPVEDNQATRLEKVGCFTTPLLRDVTGPQSPMRSLSTVLHQLDAWATDASTTPASSSLLLTRARLRQLHAYITQVTSTDALTSFPSLGLTTFPTADLEVTASRPPDLLLPACLVHCQLGVSRSPSVVLLFYMDVFQSHWRRAALRQSRETHAGDAMAGVPAANVDPVAAADVFHRLLLALVRARPRVKPNVCFAVQLLSLWNAHIR